MKQSGRAALCCERFPLSPCFIAPWTTGVQCGAFAYGNIAVGSLGSLSFPSCHKWEDHMGRSYLMGILFSLPPPPPLFFLLFFFEATCYRGEQIRLRSRVYCNAWKIHIHSQKFYSHRKKKQCPN